MTEIANHTVYSTPRILAMRGAEDFRILDSSMRAVLDRAQPNEISHLRTRDVTAVQRQLFVLPG